MWKRKGKTKKHGPDAVMQELQANIDTLSMRDAMIALKNAKEMVAKLKKEQEDALRDVQATKNDIAATEALNKEPKEYGAPSYWETRYSSISSANSSDTSSYEWYMSFNTFGPLIEPTLRSARAKNPNTSVLVAGCGNSMLCEDLYRSGYTNICGIDSSEAVIASKRRLALELGLNISYTQADMCCMPGVFSHSVGVVVDKGTLDAIISADKEQASLSYQRAVDYICEVFRLLVPNGQLLLLTTLPPHLLQELLEPLGISAATSSKHITDAGRDIFFYAFIKVHEITPPTSRGANIMSNFMGVLQSATEQLKNESNMTLDDLSTSPESGEITPAPAAAAPVESLPKVVIDVVEDISVYMIGGEVCVSYTAGGDEDDFLAIHYSSTTPVIGAPTPEYDSMEYISPSASFATLSLNYGGSCVITYNRTTTTISGAEVLRSNQVLAVTSVFSVDAVAINTDVTLPTPRFKNSRSAFKVYSLYPTFVEYQPQISKTTATILVTASRLQCWVNGNITVVEFDRIDDGKVATEYIRIELSTQLTYTSVSATTTANGNIIINAVSNGVIKIAQNSLNIVTGIYCDFCGACVCDKELTVSMLPSGTFEHMMDDCICAESDIPLAIAELTPSCATALLNDFLLCVNSKDLMFNSTAVPVLFACKETCSIIDNLLHNTIYKSSQEQQAVINIGDAHFATVAVDNKENDILVDDIESLQLLLSRVSVDCLPKMAPSQHVVRVYNTSRFLLRGKCSNRSLFLRLLTRENYYVEHDNNVVAAIRVSYQLEPSTKFTGDSKLPLRHISFILHVLKTKR